MLAKGVRRNAMLSDQALLPRHSQLNCPPLGHVSEFEQLLQLSKSAFRGKYVRCSLHAWEFDVTNGEYTGNPRIHMKCFPVKVVGDDVFLSLLPVIPAPPPKPPPLRDEA